MAEYTIVCIRPGCGTQYKSTDPDPYYCESCNEKRKELAKQIDAQIATRPRKTVKSNFQVYEEARRGRRFPSASDLGIKL